MDRREKIHQERTELRKLLPYLPVLFLFVTDDGVYEQS